MHQRALERILEIVVVPRARRVDALLDLLPHIEIAGCRRHLLLGRGPLEHRQQGGIAVVGRGSRLVELERTVPDIVG